MAEQDRTTLHDNPDVSHERSDVSIRGIVVFAVALLVVAFVIHVGLYWLLEFYREEAPSPGPVMTAPRAEEQIPPPRLQISPRADLAEMRAAQERELAAYGWSDKEKQSVRIPINRAMELLAKRGLPVRKQAQEERRK